MDTDNKTVDANNITGGEKDTLHNAGVDLSSADEKVEEFIDIDKAPAANDPDLKEIGLEFSSKENKEDLSLLKEQMDKKALAENTPTPSASVFKDEQPKPKSEEKPVEESTFSPKKKLEPQKTETDISDLEKEFNQTVGKSSSPAKNESLNEKILSLQSMLSKIVEKLGFKKTEVKEELDNLKKVKEDIAKDIENIKELEESKQKIESQLNKVDAIKGEISNIEKEVEEELRS